MGGYIPNDIMDTATALAKRLTDEMDHHEYASIIGKALMDEREESANITSTYGGDDLADIVRKDRTP